MYASAVSQQNRSGQQVLGYVSRLGHSNHEIVCVCWKLKNSIFMQFQFHTIPWHEHLGLQVEVSNFESRHHILMFLEVPCARRSTAWLNFWLATKPPIPEPLLNHPFGLSSPIFSNREAGIESYDWDAIHEWQETNPVTSIHMSSHHIMIFPSLAQILHTSTWF